MAVRRLHRGDYDAHVRLTPCAWIFADERAARLSLKQILARPLREFGRYFDAAPAHMAFGSSLLPIRLCRTHRPAGDYG